MRISVTLIALFCLFGAGARAIAQEGEAPIPAPLRGEVSLDRDIFFPGQPIPVRFTLFNPTDECVEVQVSATEPGGDRITLPRELIFGSVEKPTLLLIYEKEAPVALHVESAAAESGESRALRLGPKASLGAQIDLAAIYRQARYSGEYRLEWRPFGDESVATASFRVEKCYDAILITDHGRVKFHLDYAEAPRNVANFIELVRTKFYDQKGIHRIIPGFILQGGSPDGTNKGIRPDGKLMPAEFRDTPFEAGTLAMARKLKEPDSASCQFFISLGRNPQLDGQFTVIGQAYDEESFRTLQSLAELPVDAHERPIQPLTIRFFTLVEAQPETVIEGGKQE